MSGASPKTASRRPASTVARTATPAAARGNADALCPAAAAGPDDPAAGWVDGDDSRLCATLTEQAEHDRSQGRTRLVFESQAKPGKFVQHELPGRFRVLTHAPEAHAFVIGGLFETGVRVLMEQLAFIDDRDGSLRRSRYDVPLHIASAVVGPDLDAIALVAAPNSESDGMQLWLFRASSDALYYLGPAPAPPPAVFDCERPYPSRWLDMEHQPGYVDMDEGVITFPNATRVRASYGRDTCRGRSGRRTTRNWSLRRLTAAWTPGEAETETPAAAEDETPGPADDE